MLHAQSEKWRYLFDEIPQLLRVEWDWSFYSYDKALQVEGKHKNVIYEWTSVNRFISGFFFFFF